MVCPLRAAVKILFYKKLLKQFFITRTEYVLTDKFTLHLFLFVSQNFFSLYRFGLWICSNITMEWLYFLDFVGIVVFVVSGCMVAARRGTDVIGFIMLGTMTGIGGGTLRDVLLGRLPVFWISNPEYLIICASSAIACFVIAPHVRGRRSVLVWADAVGMAVFTVIGVQIAIDTGAPWPVALLMGVMSAAFGGILRDMMAHEVSLIFRREVYMTASVIGGLTYLGLTAWSVGVEWATLIAICVGFAVRAMAIMHGLQLPAFKTKK